MVENLLYRKLNFEGTQMAEVADKEANEVLHSLLSVDRIEKQEPLSDGGENHRGSSHNFHSSQDNGSSEDAPSSIQYASVPIPHSFFPTLDGSANFSNTLDDQQVVSKFFKER